MQLKIWQVDAFADRVFGGNPAAVVPLEHWLDGPVMQAIASENNLSETAFFAPRGDGYEIRWFTPASEVKLCGHATLASAFVVFTHLRPEAKSARFHSASGELIVNRHDDGFLELDFPARPPRAIASVPEEITEALGAQPQAVFDQDDYLAVFETAADVAAIRPDFATLMQLDRRAVIATAPGDDCDFVSRFFAPKVGVPEDPVTGSAHCILIPYWADRLGKSTLHARQISARGGELMCRFAGSRVGIAGRAALYLEGTITIPD